METVRSLTLNSDGDIVVTTVRALSRETVDELCEQIRDLRDVAAVEITAEAVESYQIWELTVKPQAGRTRDVVLASLVAYLKPHYGGIAYMFIAPIPHAPATTVAVGLYFAVMPPADPLEDVARTLEGYGRGMLDDVQVLHQDGALIILRCEGENDHTTASALQTILHAAQAHIAMQVRLDNSPGDLDAFIRAILAYGLAY